ncbi:MAG TPA: hypothetical protein VMT11_05490 [Myxococcaceae bacterium]|nr:hypothetical protein [Myxococcaceae bacterium]
MPATIPRDDGCLHPDPRPGRPPRAPPRARHFGALGGPPVAPLPRPLDFELFTDAVSLTGGPDTLLDGGEDDHHTQPSGDSGDRIACAVITR